MCTVQENNYFIADQQKIPCQGLYDKELITKFKLTK